MCVRSDRHLLLLVRRGERKSKFLCGFDERIGPSRPSRSPERRHGGRHGEGRAQPADVRRSLDGVRPKDRLRRRNAAFIRQGEWFFVPTPDLRVDEREVLRNEPLARTGGTPHVLELAARRGGRTVYVQPGNATCSRRPSSGPDACATARLGTDDGGPGALREGRFGIRTTPRSFCARHRVLMNTSPARRRCGS